MVVPAYDNFRWYDEETTTFLFPLHYHHHVSIFPPLNNGNVENGNVEVVVEGKQKKCESSGGGGEEINK